MAFIQVGPGERCLSRMAASFLFRIKLLYVCLAMMYEYLFQGENLNVAAEEDDVTVKIGMSSCYVFELTGNNLTCVPPDKQPVPTVPGATYPEVNVRGVN